LTRWRAFAVVAVAVFMSVLDLFIVNIAFPDLRREFPAAGLAGLSWVLNGYAIVFAALLVPLGKLGDVLGRRRVFRAGLLAFVLGSALAAAAPSVQCLVAARLLQAAGAAAITPTSLGLVLPLFPPGRRSTVIGAWAALGGVGAATGPVLGGLLVGLSWRWVFLVNIPIGLVGYVLARRLREFREERSSLPDGWGAAQLAGAVTLLTLGIVQGPEWGWDLRAWACLAVAGLLTVAFVARSARHPAPVLELELFRAPAFALASVSALVFFAGFAGMLLAGVLFMTEVWGFSALQAGFAVAPGPVAAAAFAAVAGRLGDRFGPAVVGAPGGLLVALGALWLTVRLDLVPAYAAVFLPGQLIIGAGVGLMLPAFTALAAATLPPARLATGIGAQLTFRQLGTTLGVAGWVAIVGNPAAGAGVLAAFDRGYEFIATCAVTAALVLLPLVRRTAGQPLSRRLASTQGRLPA
jgi:EmrB/QacA subfamily drug resistance transporter